MENDRALGPNLTIGPVAYQHLLNFVLAWSIVGSATYHISRAVGTNLGDGHHGTHAMSDGHS